MTKTARINPVGPQPTATQTPDTGDTFTNPKHLQEAAAYTKVHSGNNYLIYTDDGKVHDRTHSPCYGGHLRLYDIASDGVIRPGDLPMDFPDGHPIGLAIAKRSSAYADFIYNNKMSPWRALNGKVTVVPYGGLVVTNTHFNADILINSMFAYSYSPSKRILDADKKYDDVTLLAEFLVATSTAGNILNNGPSKWANGQAFDFMRVITGNPDVLHPFDYYDRAAYRRPIIEQLWRDKVADYIWAESEALYDGPVRPQLKGKHIMGYAPYPAPDAKKNTTIAAILGKKPGDKVDLLVAIKELAAYITTALQKEAA